MDTQKPITNDNGWPLQARHALFAFHGRIGRRAFIVGFPVVAGATLLLVYASIATAGNDQGAVGSAFSVAAILLAIAALWPFAALFAKRLHDLNRSGWHGLWIVVLWLSPNLLPDALSTLAIIASLAALFWLAAWPGNAAPNAFGEAA